MKKIKMLMNNILLQMIININLLKWRSNLLFKKQNKIRKVMNMLNKILCKSVETVIKQKKNMIMENM